MKRKMKFSQLRKHLYCELLKSTIKDAEKNINGQEKEQSTKKLSNKKK